jgi:hypothetical protein
LNVHNRPSLGKLGLAKPAPGKPALGAYLRRLGGTFALAAGLATAGVGSAFAQFFPFPSDPPPRPPASMNRTPPAPIPSPAPVPGPQGGTQWGARNPICVQLEQRLVAENQRGAQVRDQLPRIEAELRQATQTNQQGNAALERADCFEYFLFSKTLRGTRQCRDLAGQIDLAKRRIGELETQRQQITGSGGRSYTDDIVRELARNNCGANYQRDASRPSGPGGVPGFGDDSEGAASGGGYRSSQYETYRTVCVRLCDGYYFPISFSTLPGHFQQDADACQSKCAAPVELYYHKYPGEAMEQARSIKGEDPYTRLKTAFRYRKEFVQGCSCKEAEYVPPAGTVTVPMPVPAAPGAPDRRAETLPWEAPAQR